MKQHGTEKMVMESKLAGSWFSADGARLRNELEGYLAAAGASVVSEPVCGLILPHAGYAYSGPTAAYGINAVAGKPYRRVVVVGPTHRISMPNRASIADAACYRTPLGDIPMDTEMIAKLKTYPFIQYVPAAHQGENSVDLQLPLLQVGLRDFKLVVLVVGQLDQAGTDQLAQALLNCIDEETLVVASTDFTHFGTRFDYVPFTENVAERIKQLDMEAFHQAEQKNCAGWYAFLDRTRATICGRYAVGVLLKMLPEDAQVRLLHYAQSGTMTGDWDGSVSYLAAAVTGCWANSGDSKGLTSADKEGAMVLSMNDQQALLRLARGTLTYYLEHGRKPTPSDLGVVVTPAMKQVMGAFVTLHKRGILRGCIGEILPRRPLWQAVMERAVSAGVEDPRFPPVQADELPEIDVEISALTPPHAITTLDAIELGRHGIILQKGYNAAVFLPQVAPEQGWDLATTLTHLAMKAGLAPDGWKTGCSFEVFEAQVFGERAH